MNKNLFYELSVDEELEISGGGTSPISVSLTDTGLRMLQGMNQMGVWDAMPYWATYTATAPRQAYYVRMTK